MDKGRTFLNKLLAGLALFSIEYIIVIMLFVGAFFTFLFVSREIFIAQDHEFDLKAFEFLERVQSPGMTTFMESITFLATLEFIIVAGTITFLYFFFVKKHPWYGVKVPAVAFGSASLNVFLKYFFNRPRPDLPLIEAFGLSFPSGHAMVSFAFYGLLIFIIHKEVKSFGLRFILISALALLIILIGISRIYLRVHFATDVIAGFALGAIWLIITIGVLRKIERFTRNMVDSALQNKNVICKIKLFFINFGCVK
ncbi:MAG: phosphatase PAP2 family protein [Cytophagaceae bacterium]